MSSMPLLEKDRIEMILSTPKTFALQQFFCVVCCVASLFLFGACGEPKEEVVSAAETTESLRGTGQFQLTGFRTRQYTDDQLTNFIEADRATSFAGSRARTEMVNVRVRFTSGTTSGLMSSDQGTLYDVDIPTENPVEDIVGVHKGDFLLTDSESVVIMYKDNIKDIEVQAPAVFYDTTTTVTAFSTRGGNFTAKMKGVQFEGGRFTMSDDWSHYGTEKSDTTRSVIRYGSAPTTDTTNTP